MVQGKVLEAVKSPRCDSFTLGSTFDLAIAIEFASKNDHNHLLLLKKMSCATHDRSE